MPRKEVFETGRFKYSYKHYDVIAQAGLMVLEGRVYEKEFAQQLVAAGAVIQPVITTLYEGKEYLIDGRRRWLHSYELAKMSEADFRELAGNTDVKPSDFQFISAKMFYDIDPLDQATWSIILNEERKDNLIHAYLQMKELEKAGKWDEIAKLHKLNKSRFVHFAQLEKLKDQNFWMEAYVKGKVTEANLLGVAKLGGRQDFVKEVLTTKGKLTGKDIAEAKTVSVAAAINNAPAMNLPTQFVQRVSPTLFLVYDPQLEKYSGIGSDFNVMLAHKRELGEGYKLYRLVEVG